MDRLGDLGADEDGLEHVSVSPYDQSITPTWDDMCRIKDIFWDEEELVVQVHPPKSEYVNIMPNCLHLWRDKDGQIDEVLKGRMK